MKKLFALLFIIISAHLSLSAQQRTHLPYSIYGIGEIFPKGFARNMGMGRTGIALSSAYYLNNLNPASYHSIDSISFFFDFGLSADYVKYKTSDDGTQNGNDMNVRGMAFGFPITKQWKASVGVLPYSSVGYKIQTTEEIEGTQTGFYNVDITGSGGLNQFYWNNSYLLFKRLSLGVSFNYLFGNIKTSERVKAPSLMTNDIIISQTSFLNRLYADFGIQYFFAVKKDFQVTLGGVFGNSHRLKMENRITVAQDEGMVIEDEVTDQGTFEFPMYYGGGLSLVYKDKLIVSADYLYHDWSNTTSKNVNFNYRSNNIYRVGLEFIPGRFSQLGYFGGIAYRLGYYHEESYLEFNNSLFSDKGITAGLGLPFLQSKTSVNIAYNYGIKGTLKNNMVKENYHSVMVSLTLHDWWFLKRKID